MVTLDVDGSNVGWNSSQDEGATEEVRDQDGWAASQNTSSAEVPLSLLASLFVCVCVCVCV